LITFFFKKLKSLAFSFVRNTLLKKTYIKLLDILFITLQDSLTSK